MTKDEAIWAMEYYKLHFASNEKAIEAFDMAIKALEQESEAGHWIFQKIIHGTRMWCSHCNSSFDLCCSQIKRYNKATGDNDIWMYCPWCGAKMQEVANDDKI